MGKRILCTLMTLAILVSVLPMNVSMASGYPPDVDIYEYSADEPEFTPNDGTPTVFGADALSAGGVKNWALSTVGAAIKVSSATSANPGEKLIDGDTSTASTWNTIGFQTGPDPAKNNINAAAEGYKYWAALDLGKTIDISKIEKIWDTTNNRLNNYKFYYSNSEASYAGLEKITTSGSGATTAISGGTKDPVVNPGGWIEIPTAFKSDAVPNGYQGIHDISPMVSARYILLISDPVNNSLGTVKAKELMVWGTEAGGSSETLPYEVRYFYDGVEDTTLMESLTVPVAAPVIDSVPDKPKVGYRKDEPFTDPALPATISTTLDAINAYYITDTTPDPHPELEITVNKPLRGVTVNGYGKAGTIDIMLPFGTTYQMLKVSTVDKDAAYKVFGSDGTTELSLQTGINADEYKLGPGDKRDWTGGKYYIDVTKAENTRRYTVNITVDAIEPRMITTEQGVGPKDIYSPLNIRAGEHAWDYLGGSGIGYNSGTGSVEGPGASSSYSGKDWENSNYGDPEIYMNVPYPKEWDGDNIYLQTIAKDNCDGRLTAYEIETIPGADKLDSDILRFHVFKPETPRDDGDRGAVNSDRQRLEIKSNTTGSNLAANSVAGDIMTHHWRFMLPSETLRYQQDTASGYKKGDIYVTRRHFHIFQLKEILGNASPQPDCTLSITALLTADDGSHIAYRPEDMIAGKNYTPKGYLELRNNPDGNASNRIKPLFYVPLEDVVDRWLDIEVTILTADDGYIYGKLTDVSTGQVIEGYQLDVNGKAPAKKGHSGDFYRRPEENIPDPTTENPEQTKWVETDKPADAGQQNRSKWGLYRGLNNTPAEAQYADEIGPATMYLADVYLIKRDAASYIFPDGYDPSAAQKYIVAWNRLNRIEADTGTPYELLKLPTKLGVVFGTGKTASADVVWDVTTYDPSKVGLQQVYGDFVSNADYANPKGLRPYVEINVADAGSRPTNWALGANVKVTSNTSAEPPQNIVDGDEDTVWGTHSSMAIIGGNEGYKYWTALDLGQKIDISGIELVWGDGVYRSSVRRLANYQLYYSNNPESFEKLTGGQGNYNDPNVQRPTKDPVSDPGGWTAIGGASNKEPLANSYRGMHEVLSVSARYVLLCSDIPPEAATVGNAAIRMKEFLVFGKPAAQEPPDGGSDDTDDTNTPTPSASSSAPVVQGTRIIPKAELDKSTGTVGVKISEEAVNKAISNAKADADNTKTITLEIPKVEGGKQYQIDLPVSFVASEKQDPQESGAVKIRIKTDIGELFIPDNMFKASEVPGDGTLSIVIAPADTSKLDAKTRSEIGDRPVIDLSAKINGKPVAWNNPNAPVTVSIPYTPTAEELKNLEHIVVWYIDGEGKAVAVPNGKYDPDTGMVTFKTTHFSIFTITYVYKTFNDLDGFGWAKKPIEVLASKGIISGTSVNYSPLANVTRADFLYLLIKTLELTAETEGNFSDVPKDANYYEAVAVAKKLGISMGDGRNRLNPNAEISRQDMMVLTTRALKYANKLKAEGDSSKLDKFSDADSIAEYAKDSIAALINEGLILGDGTGIGPLDKTTRAAAAVLLYKIYNK